MKVEYIYYSLDKFSIFIVTFLKSLFNSRLILLYKNLLQKKSKKEQIINLKIDFFNMFLRVSLNSDFLIV